MTFSPFLDPPGMFELPQFDADTNLVPWRRLNGGNSFQELERRAFDVILDRRSRGLPPSPMADPVGAIVYRKHMAGSCNAAL